MIISLLDCLIIRRLLKKRKYSAQQTGDRIILKSIKSWQQMELKNAAMYCRGD